MHMRTHAHRCRTCRHKLAKLHLQKPTRKNLTNATQGEPGRACRLKLAKLHLHSAGTAKPNQRHTGQTDGRRDGKSPPRAAAPVKKEATNATFVVLATHIPKPKLHRMPSEGDKDLAAADDSMKTHKPTNKRGHPNALQRDVLLMQEQKSP